MNESRADALPATTDAEAEGLAVDLPLLLRSARPVRRIGRRQLLVGVLGGAGAVAVLAACGSDPTSGSSATGASTSGSTPTSTSTSSAGSTVTTDTSAATTASAGAEIPDETAGPYPGDGTNGPNALTTAGVVRSDIRSSFGSMSGTAPGIETAVHLTIVDAATGAPIPGAAVYLWHCDQGGRYSLYDVTDQNYLRGVQVADANGELTFVSIFPGCYAGRWPHAHFEVYRSIDEATDGRQAIKTSQLAYPESTCEGTYATAGYDASSRNLSGVSLSTDMVFRDGADDQLLAITGSPTAGYDASLLVRV